MNTRDEHSIAGVIEALYASISGVAGAPRDIERSARLFHPSARLVRTGVDDNGDPWARIMSHADWVADAAPLFARENFFEIETDRTEWRFGRIAHVLSRYEARHDPDDPAPERRGVNSIELYHDGERWWIMHIQWDNEREGVTSHLRHRGPA